MRCRVRAAGGPREQKCSPGDCRPVRPGAACCIATHGELWAREVCAWPMAWFGVGRYWVAWCHFLRKKCVYVHGNGIVFFGSRRRGARKKAFFVHTVCTARACCVSWPVCILHTPLAGRARQAGLESKSDLWVICIQEIQARAAESVRSARCAPGAAGSHLGTHELFLSSGAVLVLNGKGTRSCGEK